MTKSKKKKRAGHECFHCRQWVEPGDAHDCWTTTEAALTGDLAEDLRDAWERLRETAASFGDQRIYASHHSIMLSRKSCYFFVRPKRTFLELCVFLGRAVRAPQIRRAGRHRSAPAVPRLAPLPTWGFGAATRGRCGCCSARWSGV